MSTQEFQGILKEIVEQDWSSEEWARHEADDWFQTEHFHGGFEADETYLNGEFNFSYYDDKKKEWWFTFKLEDVPRLQQEDFSSIKLIDPETFDSDRIE